MENEFENMNFSETAIMVALSKYNLKIPVYSFIHDTLVGKKGTPKFFYSDNVTYVLTRSIGLSKDDTIHALETQEGTAIIPVAKQMIANKEFETTDDVVYVVAIINGRLLGSHYRTTRAIRAKARERRLLTIHEENAFLLRSKFYNRELTAMGYSKIVVMHKALKDAEGKKRLLNVSMNEGYECITARTDEQKHFWQPDTGFAFQLLKILPRKQE